MAPSGRRSKKQLASEKETSLDDIPCVNDQEIDLDDLPPLVPRDDDSVDSDREPKAKGSSGGKDSATNPNESLIDKKNRRRLLSGHHHHSHDHDHHHDHDHPHDHDYMTSVTANNASRAIADTAANGTAIDKPHDPETCLHCRTKAKDGIQVRCDECSSFICNTCHWCHEFQANHEIRVCDRCDAFYCRQCDEMDQCDDCGEVVCAQCSTLLSCKFCGGGLCEDCATACGRCGIVLCSRDAKFAVDCDTCKLSYCLVCLASGSKDPCVRCGHRPSKRMEQLVHLRLKSIYKAFKQSSNTVRAAANVRERQNDDPDESHVADDPEAIFQAAASAAKTTGATLRKSRGATAPVALADSDGLSVAGPTTLKSYIAEQEKADAAAAALLAELEEEEEAAKSKKKKKKKKKERQLAKKEEERKKDEDPVPNATDESERDMVDPVDRGPEEFADTGDAQAFAGEVATNTERDPLEEQFDSLAAKEDVDGLEGLLASVKGVPGHAILRKNIKKALKRIRSAEDEVEELSYPADKGAEEVDSRNAGRSEVQTPATSTETSTEHSKTTANAQSRQAGQSATGSNRKQQGGARIESTIHVPASCVGAIIGRGGQRIRDLMEESGSRVRIDKDCVPNTDLRLVYITGQRKNNETAARLINEIVEQSPGCTPKQSTPVAVSKHAGSSGKSPAPSIPDSDDIAAATPGRLDLKPRGNSVGALANSSEGASPSYGKSEHRMTCDPRFVPLLIGRRGWTIKNIQDTTGARVDIDQTVTPRKITISGESSNVQAAISMVNDVLSYPQAQLQGSREAPESGPTENEEHDMQQKAEKARTDVAPPDSQAKRRTHSPPSSLIMTGDAKSTVSASSSLSSTPEPSMASTTPKSSQMAHHHGPILPPAMGLHQQSPLAGNANGAFSRHQDSAITESSPFESAGAPFEQGLASGLFGMSAQPAAPLPHGNLGGSANVNGIGSIEQAPHPYPATESPSFGNPELVGFGRGPTASSPMQHVSHTGFPAAPAGLPPPVPSGLRSAAGGTPGTAGGMGRHQEWNGPNGQMAGPGPSASHTLGRQHSDGFRLDAAVDFLHHSSHSNSMPLAGGVNETIGLPSHPVQPQSDKPHGGALERTLSAPNSMVTGLATDALMVDSLFGPSTSSTQESSLLSGLQGISLDKNTPESGGLWNSTPLGGQEVKGLGTVNGISLGVNPDGFEGGNPAQDSRPQNPHFDWGGFTSQYQT